MPYSAEKMYGIVADITAYPSFLSWCKAAELISQEGDEVIAKLAIAYSILNLQLTTRNQNQPGESIHLSLVEGPFSSLQGEWQFKKIADSACKVSLSMDFQLDRKLAPSLFNKMFESIITMQLEAFHKRAIELYGGIDGN